MKGKARKETKTVKQQDNTPKYRQEFEKFHSENGVRTILGSIGPVNNGDFLIPIRNNSAFSSWPKFACYSGADTDTCIYRANLPSSMVSYHLMLHQGTMGIVVL